MPSCHKVIPIIKERCVFFFAIEKKRKKDIKKSSHGSLLKRVPLWNACTVHSLLQQNTGTLYYIASVLSKSLNTCRFWFNWSGPVHIKHNAPFIWYPSESGDASKRWEHLKEKRKNEKLPYAATLKTKFPTRGKKKLSWQSKSISGWLFTAKCQFATCSFCSHWVWAFFCNTDGATKENSSEKDWKEGTCVHVLTSSGQKVYRHSGACQSNSTFALFRLYSGAVKKKKKRRGKAFVICLTGNLRGPNVPIVLSIL